MDNFHIDITSEGDLTKAMQIAFTHYNRAVAYEVDKEKGLIFFWSDNPDAMTAGVVKLPFKLDAIGAADFASHRLAKADYGTEPDHDGDNGHGWRVYNESWGRIEGRTYSF